MSLAKGNHVFAESEDALILLGTVPIEPANLIILAIRIDVALLGPPDFVACQQHRHSSREQENRHKILDLTFAQRLNSRIVNLSFNTTIPAQIVIVAIAVLLAVEFVMFFLIGHQVIEGKAIVAGDEIDAIQWQLSSW